MTHRLMAVDPGEGINKPSIGVAFFDEEGKIADMQMLHFADLVKLLFGPTPPDVEEIVYEKYIISPKEVQYNIGHPIATIQCIGVVKAFAVLNDIKYIPQSRNILRTTSAQFELKIPSNHDNSHHICAALHGLHYLHKNGIIKTPKELAASKIRKVAKS